MLIRQAELHVFNEIRCSYHGIEKVDMKKKYLHSFNYNLFY